MDNPVDKRGTLDEKVFTHRITKDRKSWYGQPVTTLSGCKADAFIADIEATDEKGAQLLMAKATGNFKHGNEKAGKRRI